MPLLFELELFKAEIGATVYGSETRITRLIAPKICTNKDSYVPQLRCKFEVSTLSRFKVIAFFFISVYEFVKYAGKNIRTSDPKPRRSPNYGLVKHTYVIVSNQQNFVGPLLQYSTLPLLLCLSTRWSSRKAFLSGARSLRFKSRPRQIEQIDVNDSPPLRHFFEKTYVVQMGVHVCYSGYASA